MCTGNVIVALNEMSQPTSSLLCSSSFSSDLGKKRQFYEGRKEGTKKNKRPEYQKESIEMGKSLLLSFLQLYIWENTGNSTVAYFPCGGTKDVCQDIVLRHNCLSRRCLLD